MLSVSPTARWQFWWRASCQAETHARRGTIARASLTGGAAQGARSRHVRRFCSRWIARSVAAAGRRTGAYTRMAARKPSSTPRRNGRLNQVSNPRLSPSGTHVAMFGCTSGACTVRISDQSGRTVAVESAVLRLVGLAWAPGGKEVWFSVAESSGRQCTVFAMDLAGNVRMIFRAPGALTVHDISAEGRLLASFDQVAHRLELVDSPTAPSTCPGRKGPAGRRLANGVLLFGEEATVAGPTRRCMRRRPTRNRCASPMDSRLRCLRTADGIGALAQYASPRVSRSGLGIGASTRCWSARGRRRWCLA
jgi:hypothetical protein